MLNIHQFALYPITITIIVPHTHRSKLLVTPTLLPILSRSLIEILGYDMQRSTVTLRYSSQSTERVNKLYVPAPTVSLGPRADVTDVTSEIMCQFYPTGQVKLDYSASQLSSTRKSRMEALIGVWPQFRTTLAITDVLNVSRITRNDARTFVVTTTDHRLLVSTNINTTTTLNITAVTKTGSLTWVDQTAGLYKNKSQFYRTLTPLPSCPYKPVFAFNVSNGLFVAVSETRHIMVLRSSHTQWSSLDYSRYGRLCEIGVLWQRVPAGYKSSVCRGVPYRRWMKERPGQGVYALFERQGAWELREVLCGEVVKMSGVVVNGVVSVKQLMRVE